ncbi:hypothetical protein M422DRAFT_786139 [Sphaerobolus stellatus SS14]|uniref:Uncharacterized protein n=1 Tax=Sphaerobolus stellatus (strain SS14) TaxID=990650 RepID=A0A0C9UDN6_SPHS4|nr:hypothetical protein M422DRAFT_786139 [Sphaerobolus stellatus SS14]
MDTQRLLAASSQSLCPPSSPLRHLRPAPVLIVSYGHAPARPHPPSCPPPPPTTLPSTSMPRRPAVPPTMRRFHPHVKGLPPPPAIYASAHLSTSMPFVDLQASPSTSTPYTCTHPSAPQPGRHALPASPRFKHAPVSTPCACTRLFTSCASKAQLLLHLNTMCLHAVPLPRRHAPADSLTSTACVARSSTRQPPLRATCMHAGVIAL